jgi:hypothetical protein
MAEKRKPDFVFLLKKTGKKKKNKVELFNSREFGDYSKRNYQYRIRVNGCWFPKGEKEYYYPAEIKDIVFKAIRNW